MRNTKEAFLWITSHLRKEKIPFRISGCFAAKIYGSRRKLADIDIDVRERDIPRIAGKAAQFITFGPGVYKDNHWHFRVMSLKCKGQVIDICSIKAKIFDQAKQRWCKYASSLNGI